MPLRKRASLEARDNTISKLAAAGMGTHTEWHSWGAAHSKLWGKLRESARRIELVAVAWEKHILDRAERVLQSWRGQGITEAEQEAIMLRQAIADTDWEALDRHGGWDAVVQKVVQSEQETGSPNNLGMIDDFRLWQSNRCHQMGVTLTDQREDI